VSELEVEGARLQEEAAAAQDRAEASQRRVSELEVARQAGQAAIRALAASTPVIAQPKPRWIFKRRKPTTIMRADQARDAGQWQIAAGLYRIALDRNPKNPPIWMQYGHAIKESGNLADAEVAYRIAIEYDPGDADGSLQLGHVLKLQGKQAEAEIAYLQALMLNSSLDCAARELFELGWTAERLLEMGLIISRNFERL
jgi:tetratricopeptide (TPR) repeat protein